MAVRNKGKAELVKTEIARTGNGEVDYVVADLASLKEVRQLAEAFKQDMAQVGVSASRWVTRRSGVDHSVPGSRNDHDS